MEASACVHSRITLPGVLAMLVCPCAHSYLFYDSSNAVFVVAVVGAWVVLGAGLTPLDHVTTSILHVHWYNPPCRVIAAAFMVASLLLLLLLLDSVVLALAVFCAVAAALMLLPTAPRSSVVAIGIRTGMIKTRCNRYDCLWHWNSRQTNHKLAVAFSKFHIKYASMT